MFNRIMEFTEGGRLPGFVFALAATAAATLARAMLDRALGDLGQYVTFYVSVVIATLVAGRAAGMAALLTGGAADPCLHDATGRSATGGWRTKPVSTSTSRSRQTRTWSSSSSRRERRPRQ